MQKERDPGPLTEVTCVFCNDKKFFYNNVEWMNDILINGYVNDKTQWRCPICSLFIS